MLKSIHKERPQTNFRCLFPTSQAYIGISIIYLKLMAFSLCIMRQPSSVRSFHTSTKKI